MNITTLIKRGQLIRCNVVSPHFRDSRVYEKLCFVLDVNTETDWAVVMPIDEKKFRRVPVQARNILNHDPRLDDSDKEMFSKFKELHKIHDDNCLCSNCQ